jgi:hypothetical protein
MVTFRLKIAGNLTFTPKAHNTVTKKRQDTEEVTFRAIPWTFPGASYPIVDFKIALGELAGNEEKTSNFSVLSCRCLGQCRKENKEGRQ